MADCTKDRIISLDSATPRYTSYPPAPLFDQAFGETTYREWLGALPGADPLSLYVHIPFCSRLCYYCGCNTNITNKYGPIQDYLASIRREIALLVSLLGPGRPLSHLHFGGGSPTMLQGDDFSSLMETIWQYFSRAPDCEIAIEADPRHMNEERIAAFAAGGVNRLSLGVQDIDEQVLENVNRPQPFSLTQDAVDLCRHHGISHFNIDLMYGLPGQSVQSIAHTVETISGLHPDRIAFFGYAHVPWMKRNMTMLDRLPLPDAYERYDSYECGSTILKDKGYLPVGIDHFVRPSDSMAKALGNRQLKRNFQGYTTDTARNLLGIGSSSIGRLEHGYVQNIADIRLYRQALDENRLPVQKGFTLSTSDLIYGDVINEIMCYMAVDLADITARHGLDEDFFQPCVFRLAPLLEQGLAHMEGSFIRILHPHAARLAAKAFDQATSDSAYTARHSRTV